MNFMVRVAGGRWVGLSLLVGLGATLVSACGSSDGGGGGGNGGASAGASEVGSYCGTLTAKQRQCGLLSDGKITCYNYKDAAEPCETRCIAQATCADFVANACGDYYASPLSVCYAQCIGLAPVICGDGSKLAGLAHCSGSPECSDGSDEAGCADVGPRYRCRGVDQYVDITLRCDGKKDCADGSDETPDCGQGRSCMRGGAAATLSLASECDGIVDCDDASDEPAGCAVFACPNQ